MTRDHTSSPVLFFPFLLFLTLPYTPIPGLSPPNYPGPGQAHSQPGLVHPIQRDGEPQARAALVPRGPTPGGAGLYQDSDPRVDGERIPWLSAPRYPHAHSQRCLYAGGHQ